MGLQSLDRVGDVALVEVKVLDHDEVEMGVLLLRHYYSSVVQDKQ